MTGSERMTAPTPFTGNSSRAKGIERHAAFLAGTPLFKGVDPDQVAAMLGCLNAQERRYAEGEYIYRMGDTVSSLGVVVEGAVRVETVDAWGSTSVIAYKDAGKVFAESYAAVPSSPMMMSWHTCHRRRTLPAQTSSTFRSTASSWRTTWAPTAARCPRSFRRCRRKAF